MFESLKQFFRSRKQPKVNVFKQASIRMLQNSTSKQSHAFGKKERFGYDEMRIYFKPK